MAEPKNLIGTPDDPEVERILLPIPSLDVSKEPSAVTCCVTSLRDRIGSDWRTAPTSLLPIRLFQNFERCFAWVSRLRSCAVCQFARATEFPVSMAIMSVIAESAFF